MSTIVSEIQKLITLNGGKPIMIGGAGSTALPMGKKGEKDFPTRQAGIFLRPKPDGIFYYVPFFNMGGKKISWVPVRINRILLNQLEMAIPAMMRDKAPGFHELDAVLVNCGITLAGGSVVLDAEASRHIQAEPAWCPQLQQGEGNTVQFAADSLFGMALAKDESPLEINVSRNSFQVMSGGQTRALWDIPVSQKGSFVVRTGEDRTEAKKVEDLLAQIMYSRYHMGWYPGMMEDVLRQRMNVLVQQSQPLFEQREEILNLEDLNTLIDLAIEELLGEENDTNDSV